MNKKELAKFRRTLEEKRRDLAALLKKKEVDLSENEISEDDKVESSIEKNLIFSISSNEESIMEEIGHALKRIEKGSYGNCELCSKNVPEKRLRSLPWVRYCITCQKKAESKK
ncbi:MAG: TraR/DksA family transcriptional regulator [Endomicrobiia bacterium]|nr:TraR/DksA family transcriptional regulator [Endomicrobiia bacterium]